MRLLENITQTALVAIAYGQQSGYSRDEILGALGPGAFPCEEADAEFERELKALGVTWTANDLRQEIGRILDKPIMAGNEGFGAFNSAHEAAEHCIADSREIGMTDVQILSALGPKETPTPADDHLDAYLLAQGKNFSVKDLRAEIARLLKN